MWHVQVRALKPGVLYGKNVLRYDAENGENKDSANGFSIRVMHTKGCKQDQLVRPQWPTWCAASSDFDLWLKICLLVNPG